MMWWEKVVYVEVSFADLHFVCICCEKHLYTYTELTYFIQRPIWKILVWFWLFPGNDKVCSWLNTAEIIQCVALQMHFKDIFTAVTNTYTNTVLCSATWDPAFNWKYVFYNVIRFEIVLVILGLLLMSVFHVYWE